MIRRPATTPPAWAMLLAAGLCGLLAVAGCSGEAGQPSPASGDRTVAAGAGGPGGSGDEVRVGLTEWTIVTSAEQVSAGEVTFVVANTGATEHDLVVHGRRGEWRSPDLAPGERTRLRVWTAPGEQLTLWCSLPGHRAQGMHTALRVRR